MRSMSSAAPGTFDHALADSQVQSSGHSASAVHAYEQNESSGSGPVRTHALTVKTPRVARHERISSLHGSPTSAPNVTRAPRNAPPKSPSQNKNDRKLQSGPRRRGGGGSVGSAMRA